ncbi:MAG: hypothetical protein IT328_09590 [Caldilineaceae bacterium]|nr:hypothetical protein [Caldilineaceae bacterium]
MNQTQRLATQLETLRDSLEDTTPEHFILNTLLYAVEAGRTIELEEAITPLVDRWLAESIGTEEAEQDVLGAWRATVLG